MVFIRNNYKNTTDTTTMRKDVSMHRRSSTTAQQHGNISKTITQSDLSYQTHEPILLQVTSMQYSVCESTHFLQQHCHYYQHNTISTSNTSTYNHHRSRLICVCCLVCTDGITLDCICIVNIIYCIVLCSALFCVVYCVSNMIRYRDELNATPYMLALLELNNNTITIHSHQPDTTRYLTSQQREILHHII